MGKFFKKNEDGTYTEVVAYEQPEVDSIFKDRLARETAKYSNYDDLQTKLTDLNKTVETLQGEKKTVEEQLQSKDEEIKKKDLDVVRVKIKHENGIPDDLDKFLIGDTEEDIRTNAELLKKGGASAGVIIKKNDDGDGPKESASKKLAGNLFGPQGE